MRTLLTKEEVAELLGCTTRTVEKMGLEYTLTEKRRRNGKQARLYAVPSLPVEAQVRWYSRNGKWDEGRVLAFVERVATIERAIAEIRRLLAPESEL